MEGIDPQRLADSLDHSEIRRLHESYADVVTRRSWSELDRLFLAGAQIELDLRERSISLDGPIELGAFIGAALERFDYFQLVLLGSYVDLAKEGPDVAAGRMYMTELRNGDEGWSQIYGLYQDRFERAPEGWRIASRQYHSLARRFDHRTDVFSFPDLSAGVR